DELRQDRRAARPGLDRRAATLLLRILCLLQQMQVDERTFPDGTSHYRLPLLLRVARTDDHLVRLLVVARAVALCRLAPRGHRMAADRGAAFSDRVLVVDRVLGDAAGQRRVANPALAAGLGEVMVLVVGVRHRTDRAHTVGAKVTLLA